MSAGSRFKVHCAEFRHAEIGPPQVAAAQVSAEQLDFLKIRVGDIDADKRHMIIVQLLQRLDPPPLPPLPSAVLITCHAW